MQSRSGSGARHHGIWERMSSIPLLGQIKEGGNSIWQQVESQLESTVMGKKMGSGAAAAVHCMNIWQSLDWRPAGLWQKLGDGTIFPESHPAGVWDAALEETLILDRSARTNVYRELADVTFILHGDSSVELWREVGDETVVISRPEENIWEKARGSHGFTEMTPTRLPGYALKKFETVQGEQYYILKNLRQGSYLRLTERQYFLWELMDGESSIQDIAVAYMTAFGSLDVSILVELLGKLTTGGFLTSQTTNIYAQLQQRVGSSGWRLWAGHIVRTFLQREFPLPHMDDFYTRMYNSGVHYLYARPAQLIMLIFAVTGTAAFIYLLATQKYSVITGATSNVSIGVVLLYLTNMFALFIHEGGHAFTCKSYGRTIRKSGVMIYYGFFAFYVDSTDIWMEPRRARIMVSFGGPFTGFVLGGIASLFSVFSPWTLFNGWAFQFAFLIIVDSIMNLNPLLKWDGYYILMDWLEIPNLRTRALSYLKTGRIFSKLIHREKFNREERIFTLYGFATFFYTASIIFAVVGFFGKTIVSFIARFFDPRLLTVLLILVILFLTRNKIFRFFNLIKRKLTFKNMQQA